ncbi:hypothetical protein CH063_00191, partial [Colletotrichum higginsianum]
VPSKATLGLAFPSSFGTPQRYQNQNFSDQTFVTSWFTTYIMASSLHTIHHRQHLRSSSYTIVTNTAKRKSQNEKGLHARSVS